MHATTVKGIEALKKSFDAFSKGKQSLLQLLEETELSEAVYNSNAIENSTLTLDETEKILLYRDIPPFHTQREIFEALNLAQVTEYLNEKIKKNTPLTSELMLLVHGTLISHINNEFAGRFRGAGEYVRVGRHIAPPPEQVLPLVHTLLEEYNNGHVPILDRIIRFHLEFERVHPFCDGNGRVGRALLNFQLKTNGYPPIIIRNKEKRHYYDALIAYDDDRSTKKLELIVSLLLKETLHRRIAYLRGDEILFLGDIAKSQSRFSMQALNNAAKKQSLPAFRERGRWKVGRVMFEEWMEE